jgi:opacity protein-like surface antigen
MRRKRRNIPSARPYVVPKRVRSLMREINGFCQMTATQRSTRAAVKRLLLFGENFSTKDVTMRLTYSNGIRAKFHVPIVAALGLLVLPRGNAMAEDVLGLYVGGAIGQSRVEASASSLYGGYVSEQDFQQNHSAFKVMAGVRPISLLGGEMAYVDFGHPSGSLFGYPADASVKGAAAFGILYLPIPILDIYVKAGLARLESSVNGGDPNPVTCGIPCGPALFRLNRTNTSGAGGAGVQYKFGSWAVRAEYERFNAAGGYPSLLSAGITWTFF